MREYKEINWDLIKAFAGKMPDARVGRMANCTYMTVLRYRQEQGIPSLKRRGYDWQKYKALLEDDVPAEVIAKIINCPIDEVLKARHNVRTSEKEPLKPLTPHFPYKEVMDRFYAEVGAETYWEKYYCCWLVQKYFKEEEANGL